MAQHQTDEITSIERKRGEKLSTPWLFEELPPKGAFIDANKRMPDEIVDHDEVQRAVGSLMPRGVWAIAPDMVADVSDSKDGSSYAVLHGENKDNQPVVGVINHDFDFTILEAGKPYQLPGARFEITWLLHNGQIMVRPLTPQDKVMLSGFVMYDK